MKQPSLIVFALIFYSLVDFVSNVKALRPPDAHPISEYGPFLSDPYPHTISILSTPRSTSSSSPSSSPSPSSTSPPSSLLNGRVNMVPAFFSGMVLNTSALATSPGVEIVLPDVGADPTLCSVIPASPNYVGKMLLVMYTGCPAQTGHLGVLGILMYGCPTCASGLIAVVVGGNFETGGNGNVNFPYLYIRFHDGALIASYLSQYANSILVTMMTTGTGNLDPTEKLALASMREGVNFPPFIIPIYYWGSLPWSTPLLLLDSYDPCTSATPLAGLWCENGHVTFISHADFFLTGTFYPNIDKLTKLAVIGSALNSLTGPLPSSLCSLSHLMILDVSNNFLTALPDCLSSMHNLFQVTLNDNKITNLPESFKDLADTMMSISLQNNLITSFPSFSSFKSLTDIDISNNNATGTISDFSNNPALTSINLKSNRLSGCVDASFFDNLPSLTSIDLSHNQICGPLPNFLNAGALTSISLQANNFSGPVPATWASLSSLTTLTASNNSITSPVNTLALTPKLTTVDLSWNLISNSFSGTFTDVGDFVRRCGPNTLTSLVLDGNKLTGFWASTALYGVLPLLTHLSVSHNQITALPSTLFDPNYSPPFTFLDFSYNALNGSAFPSGSPSSSMTFLSLIGNPSLTVLPLPSWLSASSSTLVSSAASSSAAGGVGASEVAAYACPLIVSNQNQAMQVHVDPVFNAYQGCVCSNGYYGVAPNCILIPSVVEASESYRIDDSIYGAQRFSSGMDTSFIVSLPSDSLLGYLNISSVRMITLRLTIFPEFNRSANTLSISLAGIAASQIASNSEGGGGGGSTSGDASTASELLVASITSLTASAINQTVQVFDSAASVNYKSKDRTATTHFMIQYEFAFQCPTGYQFSQAYQRCYQMFIPNSSYSIAVFIMVGFVWSVLCFVTVVIVIYRNSKVIMASSFPFCVLMLIFLNILIVGSLFYAVEPSSSSFPSLSSLSAMSGNYICHARPWFTATGVVGLMACLLVKTTRIKTIFIRDSLTGSVLSNQDLFIIVGGMMLIEWLLLIVYSSLSAFSSTLQSVGSGATNRLLVNHCVQPSDDAGYEAWIIMQFLYVACFLIGSLSMAFSVRNVPSAFNESSHIVNCFAALLSLGMIVVIVQFVASDDPNALMIIRGFGQSIISLLLCLSIFGPKLYVIFDGRANEAPKTSIGPNARRGKEKEATTNGSGKSGDRASDARAAIISPPRSPHSGTSSGSSPPSSSSSSPSSSSSSSSVGLDSVLLHQLRQLRHSDAAYNNVAAYIARVHKEFTASATNLHATTGTASTHLALVPGTTSARVSLSLRAPHVHANVVDRNHAASISRVNLHVSTNKETSEDEGNNVDLESPSTARGVAIELQTQDVTNKNN